MKKFSKVLCLVLVLAMMAGLCCFGTSAAYSDAAKITYKEAVDVMSEIGVLQGDANGFRPQDGLTRAEACKITTVLTGNSGLNVTADFKDTQNHWANGYIGYCALEGFVNGVGNNKFNPDGALTGYAFAKMLFCAVGYNAEDKGMTGSAWELGVAKMIKAFGLTAGIVGFDGNKAITREQAAQMALNAAKLQTVTYTAGTQIAGSNITVNIGGETKNSGTNLLKDVFGVTVNVNGAVDNYGRPTTTYTRAANTKLGITKIALSYTATPDFTFNTAMTEAELFAALGEDGELGTGYKYVTMSTVYVDGTAKAAFVVKNSGIKTAAEYFGNGTNVEVYASKTQSNVFTMIAYNEYVGTVTKVTKANPLTGAARYVTVSNTALTESYTFTTEDFALGDTVIYTHDTSAVALTVKAPETVTGKVTKLSAAGVYTIGDAEYKLSANNVSTAPTVGATVTWYLDSCGNLIKAKAVAYEAWNYGYLVGYAYQGTTASGLLTSGTAAAEKYQLITADGKTTVLDGVITTNSVYKTLAPSFKANTDTTDDGVQSYVLPAATLVQYRLNADGKVKEAWIVDAAGTKGNSANTAGTPYVATKGSAQFAGKYVTDKTIFIAYKDNTNYAVYVGANALPAAGLTSLASATKAIEYFYAYNTVDDSYNANTLAAVVIKVSTAAAASATNYAYFASMACYATTTEAGTEYTYTDVYVNGVKGELKTLTQFTANAGDRYSYTTNLATGYATLVTKYDGAGAVTDVQGSYFVAGGNVKYYTTATKIYAIEPITKTLTEVSVENVATYVALSSLYTVTLLAVEGGTLEAPATAVYVSVAENP